MLEEFSKRQKFHKSMGIDQNVKGDEDNVKRN